VPDPGSPAGFDASRGRRHARNAVRSSTHATPTAAARRRRGTEKLALSELELAASELPMARRILE